MAALRGVYGAEKDRPHGELSLVIVCGVKIYSSPRHDHMDQDSGVDAEGKIRYGTI